jgi:hypothetical protein
VPGNNKPIKKMKNLVNNFLGGFSELLASIESVYYFIFSGHACMCICACLPQGMACDSNCCCCADCDCCC